MFPGHWVIRRESIFFATDDDDVTLDSCADSVSLVASRVTSSVEEEVGSDEDLDGFVEDEGELYEWEDELIPDALDILRVSKRASTSMFQRRLKIGYNRAARIMEILEREEIVGPDNGQQPREILKDLERL